MATVDLYTTEFCPFCDRAKRLLKQKGVSYREHDLTNLSDAELHAQMKALSGQRTVPQIVIDGKAIGGWQELSALELSGKLDAMLKSAA